MGLSLKYEQVKILSEEQFRRLTGVKRGTFDRMIKILEEADKNKKKLGMETQLLMALEYIREYRTYFHVSTKVWNKRKFVLQRN